MKPPDDTKSANIVVAKNWLLSSSAMTVWPCNGTTKADDVTLLHSDGKAIVYSRSETIYYRLLIIWCSPAMTLVGRYCLVVADYSLEIPGRRS